MSDGAASANPDRRFAAFNGVISAGVLGFLTWLLVIRQTSDSPAVDLSFLPAVNAGFNASAAVLLVLGWMAIRKQRRDLHQRLMVASFACSAMFFIGYLIYHYVHGDTRYAGELRWLYLPLLISHIVLSIPVLPMALAAFYLAWRERFHTHRKVTRILAPIWLYVSVSGVIVFFMLHG